MPRRTLLPALVAFAAAGLAVTLSPAPAPASAAPVAAEAPLSLTIDTLTPSSVPAQGKVRISGWVTNNSDEVWTSINVYGCISDEPITDSGDLAFESTRDAEEQVCNRITVPGTFDSIEQLNPGATLPYTDRIPVELLRAEDPGAYWFGVHALGSNSAGRDIVADGRARTFLPSVPREGRGAPIDTALVLPIRHQVLHDPDGSLSDVDGWDDTLDEGGRLSSILDFGLAAGGRPLTWLVDPAVPAAAKQLADGNPRRNLVESADEEAGVGEGGDGSATPSEGATPTPEPQDPATKARADTATRWLVKLNQAVTGRQVLALPWGDVDVAAAAKRATDVYTDARDRSGTVLNVSQTPMTPAMAAPSGFLDDAALALADDSTTVLVSDRAVSRGQPPSVATYDGQRVVFYSSDVLAGGPGPDDPLSPVAVRQRILSEAAVRMAAPARRPLVVVFPPSWTPPGGPDYSEFFDGLDVSWMRLTTLADATAQPSRPLPADRFEYPRWQVNHEVDDDAFTALADLDDEARRLQGVLSVESDLSSRIRADALGNVSYFARENVARSRLATIETTTWVRDQLGSITVSGPRQVILSSDSGPFSVTITNDLDVPVSVRIVATSDPPMTIRVPEELELAANSTTTKVLEASTNKLGVHDVEIALTDLRGKRLGSTDTLRIRAAQVSQVIWLIMGVAVGLLFLAIVLRIIRRIRGGPPGGRHDSPSEPAVGPASGQAREPEPAAPTR